MKNLVKKKLTPYYAGLMVSRPRGADIEGPTEVMFAGLVGALLGFVLGMLAGTITRIVTINSAKGSRGGLNWAAWGAGAGGMALAVIELLN